MLLGPLEVLDGTERQKCTASAGSEVKSRWAGPWPLSYHGEDPPCLLRSPCWRVRSSLRAPGYSAGPLLQPLEAARKPLPHLGMHPFTLPCLHRCHSLGMLTLSPLGAALCPDHHLTSCVSPVHSSGTTS